MNSKVLLLPIYGFLSSCSDECVEEKWMTILKKPVYNWKRLEVFDLWIKNQKGFTLSVDYHSKLLTDIIGTKNWNESIDVHIYMVGRNKKNGYHKLKLLDGILFPMIEGVLISSVNHNKAICISHDGDVRVFN
jgi:hypothetical protein